MGYETKEAFEFLALSCSTALFKIRELGRDVRECCRKVQVCGHNVNLGGSEVRLCGHKVPM